MACINEYYPLGEIRVPHVKCSSDQYQFGYFECYVKSPGSKRHLCTANISAGLPCVHMLAVCNVSGFLPGIEYARMEWWRDEFFPSSLRLDIRDALEPLIVHEKARVSMSSPSRKFDDSAPSRPPESLLMQETILQVHLPVATNASGGQRKYRIKQTWKKGKNK